MNHCVPDFELDDDCSIPTSSSFLNRSKRSAMAEDDIMELLWHNGQVVVQSQNQRSLKKSPPSRHGDTVIAADQSTPSHVGSSHPQQQLHHHHHQQNPEHMFMQEDEMASWLQYPLNDTNFDSDFCADLLYPTPCVTSTSTAVAAQLIESPQMNSTVSASVSAPRPPIPPPRRMENFGIFSRHRARAEPSNPKSAVVRESTVVESNDTPVTGPVSRVSEAMRSTDAVTGVHNVQGTMSSAGAAGTSSAAGSGGTKDLACGGGGGMKDSATCELTVTSSPGGSSASAEPGQKAPTEDRKRKGRDAGDDECHSEDIEFESADTKKQTRGSTSTKRSRAAEVHNLSERRRRDRINEKMRALQELIPRCNKSDKASMLDEAIEYLKSLQLQVQMMSMGCGMVPMMFPGIQQYMPAMGMGMGMAMGMEMGMSRPMMPFPNVIPGTAMPTPGAAAHLAPRFPIPQFSMPAVPVQDPSRAQATNQPDPMLHSFMQNPSQPRMPNFSDPYQHYLGLHQMQLPLQQNQSMSQPSPSKPSSSSKGSENPDNHPSG